MSANKGFNRREFLKVIGAGTGLAASGCATDIPEKLIPYVVQPDEVVPGNALWYAASCNECSSGCGVLVRTREGRAVKVEGNPKHPVNRGGLCALGQSSVQALYDPDRVREPLRRDPGSSFKPASWSDAVDEFAGSINNSSEDGKKTVFITRPLQPTEKKLFKKVTAPFSGIEHIEYELLSDAALNYASEKLYGKGVRTNFDFSKADVVVGFGADYLETWISPVRFSKDYSYRRVPENGKTLSKVYHVEPRLSLTGANADYWLKNAPGSELSLLKALLHQVAKKKSVSGERKKAVDNILKDFDLSEVLSDSGINTTLFNQMVEALVSSKTSLVVAGGAAVSRDANDSSLIALILNEILGNTGKTVLLSETKENTEQLTPSRLKKFMSDLEEKKIGTIVFVDTNPIYTLPNSNKFTKAISGVSKIISISKSLDETSKLANVVLPLSTSFECWGDSEPLPGVYALSQPSMQPIFKTQGFGNILLSLDASAENKKGGTFKKVMEYRDYLEEEWKNILGSSNFKSKWQDVIQAGGDWSRSANYINSVTAKWSAIGSDTLSPSAKLSGLTAIAYPTVRFHDGRGANRPWMQEMPDPMTTSVWGSWVELHPDTASKLGISEGDVVQLGSDSGSLASPVYITKNIHPSALGIPIGGGHEGYGRFASGVGVNPLTLLSLRDTGNEVFSLLKDKIELRKSVSKEKLVALQFSDTEYKRGFVRNITEEKYTDSLKDHSSDDHHEGGHHDPLALGPREEPKQMYEQMEHPLYRWGMSVDLSTCTGCSACVTACYAENNVPVVGKQLCDQGREMSWIKISRYFDGPEEHPVTGFAPMMCQHCNNAPCEPVCPVYATYHSEEGLNTMVYNRCVGTRYCSNNCSYKVRRFNWFNYEWPEPLNWQLNPDVTVRGVGIMEKCTFCIQRIRKSQNTAKDEGRLIEDGEILPACASSCPTNAISFGNLKDEKSDVYELSQSKRGYKVLDFQLNTQPAVTYLAKVTHDELVSDQNEDHSSHDESSDH